MEGTMTTIKISDFSTEAASQSKGLLLRDKLDSLLTAKTPFAVDFNGIARFASPFFNNSFASLALIYGFDTIEAIPRLNLSEVGETTFHTSMDNSKLLSTNPDFTQKINKIINDNLPKKES